MRRSLSWLLTLLMIQFLCCSADEDCIDEEALDFNYDLKLSLGHHHVAMTCTKQEQNEMGFAMEFALNQLWMELDHVVDSDNTICPLGEESARTLLLRAHDHHRRLVYDKFVFFGKLISPEVL